MATEEFFISISPAPIHEVESRWTTDPRYGADLQFLGVVRALEGEDTIQGIDYSCYQAMAERQLEQLVRDMRTAHPDHRVLIHHRTGFVAAGEPSIIIRVQAPHSQEGYDLSREYLRRIKTTVPIWKHPVPASS